MYETIKKTATQFSFDPQIVNGQNLASFSEYLVVGMGGSHLAAGLVKLWQPQLDLVVHSNYGLPQLPLANLRQKLIILSSYSGNTEEVLDAYEAAGKLGLTRAVITIGGKLLDLAKKDNVAYIQMPDWGIQPRAALGLSLNSFLKITRQEAILAEVSQLQSTFHPESLESSGQDLATELKNLVPVIYASTSNEILAYIWKITFNETGKIPAFMDVFPEVNHNEMTGFDVSPKTAQLSRNFHFLFLSDPEDDPRIKERMAITAQLYHDRGLSSKIITLDGANKYLKIFNALALVDFAAYFTAESYGLESEQVPMVEEFKKML